MASSPTMAMVIGRTRCSAPAPGHGQDEDDGFGAVGHRRQRVERQRREPLDRGDAILAGAQGRFGRADQQVPDAGDPSAPGVSVSHRRTLEARGRRVVGRRRGGAGSRGHA